jgi:hypothetical protein
VPNTGKPPAARSEKDWDVLEPKGAAGLQLKMAKYALGVFQRFILANFRR